MNNIGIFLDRDGTINEELEFISSPDDIKLIPLSADAIRQANEIGLKVFVITNQSGVARGFIKEEELVRVHNKLVELLNQEGAHIDAIYFCPHHPELGEPPYKMECECRKPNSGMLRQAEKEFNIDLKKSFVVGDRIIDIQAASAVGATGILVLTGYGKNQIDEILKNNIEIDYIAENLYDAMQFIKTKIKLNT